MGPISWQKYSLIPHINNIQCWLFVYNIATNIYLKTGVLVTRTDDRVKLTLTLGEVADVLPAAVHAGEDLAGHQDQDQGVEHGHHDGGHWSCPGLVTSVCIILTFITHHLWNMITGTGITTLLLFEGITPKIFHFLPDYYDYCCCEPPFPVPTDCGHLQQRPWRRAGPLDTPARPASLNTRPALSPTVSLSQISQWRRGNDGFRLFTWNYTKFTWLRAHWFMELNKSQ